MQKSLNGLFAGIAVTSLLLLPPFETPFLFSLNDGEDEVDGDSEIEDADLTDKINPVCFLAAFLFSASFNMTLGLVDGLFGSRTNEDCIE